MYNKVDTNMTSLNARRRQSSSGERTISSENLWKTEKKERHTHSMMDLLQQTESLTSDMLRHVHKGYDSKIPDHEGQICAT